MNFNEFESNTGFVQISKFCFEILLRITFERKKGLINSAKDLSTLLFGFQFNSV